MKSRASDLYKFNNPNFNSEKFDNWRRANPKEWKKLKAQFDNGRLSFECQFYNGIDIVNENVIRMFLFDYNTRFLQYGSSVFPASFNLLEPFFNFNHHTSILELVEEEESYGLSLEDFLDNITSNNFDLSKIDLYEEIPEQVIYNFTFTSGVFDYPFRCEDKTEYFIGHVSLIRRDDEVTVLLHAGRIFSEVEAKSIEEKYTKEKINEGIITKKKRLGFKIEHENNAKVVNYLNREDLWLHLIASKIDLRTRTIDIRYFAKDCNIVYESLTDDFSVLISDEEEVTEDKIEEYVGYLKELEKRNSIFEFAKYCMTLPKYVFDREQHIVPVDYPTKLSEVISGPISKRKYKDVPLSIKVFAKPFYYLESPLTSIRKMKSVRDDSFHIEKSGYWKRLRQDEKGLDKRGKEVIGKTWVERNDTYYIEKEGVVNVKPSVIYNELNSGLIYIMRQPGHHENVFKVGLTKRSSDKRSKELTNTSVPDNFYVIVDYNVRDCIEAEKLIHKELEEFRISDRREFFNCDLKHIIQICEKIIEKINTVPSKA